MLGVQSKVEMTADKLGELCSNFMALQVFTKNRSFLNLTLRCCDQAKLLFYSKVAALTQTGVNDLGDSASRFDEVMP